MRQQTRTRKRQIKKTAVQQNKHTKEDTVKTVSFFVFYGKCVSMDGEEGDRRFNQ